MRCYVVCRTERFAADEATRDVKRHNKHNGNNDAFLPTVVAVVVVAGLASLALLSLAVHRRQRGGDHQPPCSQTTKVESGGTAAGAVVGGKALESAGLLARSSYGQPSKMTKTPPQPPVDRMLSTRRHRSALRGPRHLGVAPYRPPVWDRPPPPPPPPSSVVDDAFSEFSSMFAGIPSNNNNGDDDDDDGDYDNDNNQLKTIS